ncbi:anhydro-N-acetylmuramic acid kinase [Psychrobacter sp. I-STPA10]|uniref:anhydro-N-acetylmuramic acid kinase n=1 Tax=Psychrobacter sp. I-STPA10 TaxID=2585769 RepID=UPI001E561CFF|nr:anhydro-N-acetylmuramic acid kinase [Psychrobacter sp. I-STPA10]
MTTTPHNTSTTSSIDALFNEDTTTIHEDNPIHDHDMNELTQLLENTVFESFDEGLYIGMMSGTSLDALDAVICRFNPTSAHNNANIEDKGHNHKQTTGLSLQLLATHSKPLPNELRTVLLALCQPNGVANLSPAFINSIASLNKKTDSQNELLSELDWWGWASRHYALFASEVVAELLSQSQTDSEEVIAIGCHGQTVRHRPQLGFSLQLVDANLLAEYTGMTTVSDFRRRDMAVGGQGAPLVPAFHQALFCHPTQTRVVLNLGGIANLTLLPPLTANTINETNKTTQAGMSQVIGFDTGPANLLLDAWAHKHTGNPYDAGGEWGRSGQIIPPLLSQLLTHAFFAQPAPKSTGREDFNLSWLEHQLEIFAQTHTDNLLSPANIQATLTELTAISSSEQIMYCLSANKLPKETATVYVCGGGAYNVYLLERLKFHLPNVSIETTQSLGLAPTWVEAVAFAWLARQTIMGEVGNLPAVTGASKGVVLGQVCFA